MKNLIFILFITFSSISYAGYTTCSNETLYYSNVNYDFGIEPPPGTKLGTSLIVFKSEILLKKTKIAGTVKDGIDSHRVELMGPSDVLDRTGNKQVGTSTYKKIAVLYKTDGVNSTEEAEITRQDVTCQDAWAMVF